MGYALNEAYASSKNAMGYGVRPCCVHTLEDQLGLVPGTKSKIEDGSTVGTSVTLRTALADFR